MKCKNHTTVLGLFHPNHFFSTLEALRDICLLSNILAVNNFYGEFFLMHNEGWDCWFSLQVFTFSFLSVDTSKFYGSNAIVRNFYHSY